MDPLARAATFHYWFYFEPTAREGRA